MISSSRDFCSLLRELIVEIHGFHGQNIYSGMGSSIANKKPIFYLIFYFIRNISKSRIINMLTLAAVVLWYRAIREPDLKSRIFQYGMAQVNLEALERLNLCLPNDVVSDVSIDGSRISLRSRISVIASVGSLWRTSKILVKMRHERALVHLQTIIGCAAFLIYYLRPFPKKLEAVCVASDHSPVCQALIFVAHLRGIRTCYVQHAPVTEYFPALNFNLAILFDRASVEAYEKASRRYKRTFSTPVSILPPFETDFVRPQLSCSPYNAGLCLSFLSDINGLTAFVESLSSSSLIKEIFIRRHPRCMQNWNVLSDFPKVTLSSRIEPAEVFFKKVDFVLVPNSGVAIQSLHCGKPTYYVKKIDRLPDDYYGFVSVGLLPTFDFSLLQKSNDFFDSNWKIRFSKFDETVNSSREVLRASVVEAFKRHVVS